jgi:hypothetical protein
VLPLLLNTQLLGLRRSNEIFLSRSPFRLGLVVLFLLLLLFLDPLLVVWLEEIFSGSKLHIQFGRLLRWWEGSVGLFLWCRCRSRLRCGLLVDWDRIWVDIRSSSCELLVLLCRFLGSLEVFLLEFWQVSTYSSHGTEDVRGRNLSQLSPANFGSLANSRRIINSLIR